VAIYTDVKANYSISSSYDGTVTVSHTGGAANEGTDTLKNIEYIKFSDGYYDIATSTWNNGGTVPGLTGTQSGAQTGGATYGDGATNIGGLALNAIKVQTQSDSKNAVTILDRSLQQVASARAKLGAIMNRLQHNIDNQTNSGLNIRQARGRIVDSDLAIESTKLAQQMILSQAAQQAINMAAQRQLTVLALLET
jgi:flagellin